MRMRITGVQYKRRAATCSFYLMLPAVALCDLVSVAVIHVSHTDSASEKGDLTDIDSITCYLLRR